MGAKQQRLIQSTCQFLFATVQYNSLFMPIRPSTNQQCQDVYPTLKPTKHQPQHLIQNSSTSCKTHHRWVHGEVNEPSNILLCQLHRHCSSCACIQKKHILPKSVSHMLRKYNKHPSLGKLSRYNETDLWAMIGGLILLVARLRLLLSHKQHSVTAI